MGWMEEGLSSMVRQEEKAWYVMRPWNNRFFLS